jgi:lipoate-protein ligase A
MNSLPFTNWRLIITPPSKGAWNMALDEAILDSVRRDEVRATLRLYAWQPACLSLGYAQSVNDVNLKALQENGWDLVRRPTGGRAILHTDELTYSVIGPPDDSRLSGSVLESYRCLSQALLHSLHLLNVPAEAHEIILNPGGQQPVKDNNPVCFEVPSNYEIIVDNKKLIGSAQARKRDGVLQHGSLPLFGDLTRIVRVLNYDSEEIQQEAANRLLARAITVEGIINQKLAWETAAQAFIQSFQEVLNLKLVYENATPQEEQRAIELMNEKYAHISWTNRV